MRIFLQDFRVGLWLLLAWGFFIPNTGAGQVKFIPNKGQWDAEVQYRADVTGGALYVLHNSLRYNFLETYKLHDLLHSHNGDTTTIGGQAIFAEWEGANISPALTGNEPGNEIFNYYLGNDRASWASGLYGYNSIYFKELYPGIGMLLEGMGDQVKYTYTVAPGADPDKIKLRIKGADDIYLQEGRLHITTRINSIVEEPPYAYQMVEGQKVEVKCGFRLDGNLVSIIIAGRYDKKAPLIIDPTVIFATYSGSVADNFGFTGTYDTLGNGYAGGTVYAPGFPFTAGFYQETFAGGITVNGSIGNIARDCGIMKYAPDGRSLIYSTYLGGKHNEQPHSMIVNNAHELIIFGTTYSVDFPVTTGALHKGETDIFVCKLSEDGKKLIQSTLLGGSSSDGLNGLIPNGVRNQSLLGYNYGDQFRGEVVNDDDDNIYVASTTFSNDFPVTSGSVQPGFGGQQDGCIFKMDSSLNLMWSTYIGGGSADAAYSLQIDKGRNVFACGGTHSNYFFSDNNTYQNTFKGDSADGFICHISGDGSKLLNATYLGTSGYDQTYFIQLDDVEDVYVYGQTNGKWPVINAGYSNPNSGQFITRLDHKLEKMIMSTVFGSGRVHPDISPTAFLVDRCGKIYISGWGGNTNEYPLGNGGFTSRMVITPDAYQSNSVDSSDFYVAVFARNADTILYGSYFGGASSAEHVDGGTSRFDKKGIIYQSVCGGCHGNSDFPTTDSAWSKVNRSQGCNNLLFKVNLDVPDLEADFTIPLNGCAPLQVNPVNKSKRAKTYKWDFGDGSPVVTGSSPTHLYNTSGKFEITLIAENPITCLEKDTVRKTIEVYHNALAKFVFDKVACSPEVKFTATGSATTWTWDFGDGATDIGSTVTHTYAKEDSTYIITLSADKGTPCENNAKDSLSLAFPHAAFSSAQDSCYPVVQFINESTKADAYLWKFSTGDSSVQKDPLYNFQKKGDHSVSLIITDSAGCKDTITRTIVVKERFHGDFTFSPDTCSGTLKFEANEGAGSVLWLFGDGSTSEETDPEHLFPEAKKYTVTLISNPKGNCPDSITKEVRPEPRPAAKFVYEIDTCTSIIQAVSESYRAYTYLWIFGDGASDSTDKGSVVHQYIHNGSYTLRLIINPGSACADTTELPVQIDREQYLNINIPNVFTPNNDGKNDRLRVGNLSNCLDYVLKVYNRWGQLMYEEHGNKIAWDGTYEGRTVPEGVYYYVFEGPGELRLKGTVSVFR